MLFLLLTGRMVNRREMMGINNVWVKIENQSGNLEERTRWKAYGNGPTFLYKNLKRET